MKLSKSSISLRIAKLFIAVMVLSIFTISCGDSYNSSSVNVIPKPVSVRVDTTKNIVGSSFTIISENENIAEYFSKKISELTNLKSSVDNGKEAKVNSIKVEVKSITNSEQPEGYELIVDEESISIIGNSEVGSFYGIQTLLQIISNSVENGKVEIPIMKITDSPRFNWRGMHLDVSRHFFGKEFVKKYLDVLALHKMNVFHWHLTDDQGWRIEIDAYPKLTEIAAWRKGNGKEKWNYEIEAALKGKEKYGGFYTKDDVKEIVAYAKKLHITVVPEIELPAHSWAALNAYPELSCSGISWVKSKKISFEFSDPFCVGNEKTFEFFEKVFSEVIELFPSKYIHLGGDEAKKLPWEKCTKCQQRMHDEGFENVDQLQTYFVNRVAKFIESKGRKAIGWDEVALDNPNTNLTIMSWRGDKNGMAALEKGNSVVFTPEKFLYFNKPQYSAKVEEGGSSDILPIEQVYNYNPVPDSLPVKLKEKILGVEGCLWSEYIYYDKQAFERILPRLAALSEAAWSSLDSKDFEEFNMRLNFHYNYLKINNCNYFLTPPIGLEDDVFVSTPYKITLSSLNKSSKIFYTIDGSTPTEKSIHYNKPINVEDDVTVKAITIDITGEKSAVVSANYKKVKLENPQKYNSVKKGVRAKLLLGKINTLENFNNLKFSSNFTTHSFELLSDLPKNNYGILFNGLIKIPSDNVYTFYLSSDDGSRLYINNRLIVDYDGVHGMGEVKGKIALKSGYHKIEVKYFEAMYGEGLKVMISGGNMDKQIISDKILFHNKEK